MRQKKENTSEIAVVQDCRTLAESKLMLFIYFRRWHKSLKRFYNSEGVTECFWTIWRWRSVPHPFDSHIINKWSLVHRIYLQEEKPKNSFDLNSKTRNKRNVTEKDSQTRFSGLLEEPILDVCHNILSVIVEIVKSSTEYFYCVDVTFNDVASWKLSM